MNTDNIRVRFAPSPTGYLHVGGLRTALYNYLFARKHSGTFVLRIEDTDRARFVEGAVANLVDTLCWAGLAYDEGPGTDGRYGPYIQSERLQIYRDHAEALLMGGHAYRCFCTPVRLDEMRKERERAGLLPKYDKYCLTHTDESRKKLAAGTPSVVRMNVTEGMPIRFHDLIRGDVEFSSDQIDDQVLLKSDGYPTYHLANVVDDHLMEISHVIRGEEWLSSTPKHVLLYRYFGWNPPQFAHLPLLLNPDRSKLSKRQGDVAVEEYRAKGYLKEALINFVALLGWNPGDERELFTLEGLTREFSLERVGKAGAIFNIDKLNWLNFQHLRNLPEQDLLRMLKNELQKSGFDPSGYKDDYLLKVIRAMRDRVTFVQDFIEKSRFFFKAPENYDAEVLRKRWKADTADQMKKLASCFNSMASAGQADFEKALHLTADQLSISPGSLIHAVRLAVSGTGTGPGLYEMLEVLGKDESVKRIRHAVEHITMEST